MKQPERCVPTTSTCPDCWTTYGIPGKVVAIVDADGAVLWQRCVCGAEVPTTPTIQQELF